MMRCSNPISEIKVSRTLFRLEDLGLVDDQNSLTQAGSAGVGRTGMVGQRSIVKEASRNVGGCGEEDPLS